VTNVNEAIAYVKGSNLLDHHDGASSGQLTACELCEGQINFVFRVCMGEDLVHEDSNGSRMACGASPACIVLKHAPPYVKSLGEGTFPLDQVVLSLWNIIHTKTFEYLALGTPLSFSGPHGC
jgi:5-methylthioribose kinase